MSLIVASGIYTIHREHVRRREAAARGEDPDAVAPRRRPDPDGDRVVVTFDGKFLPYRW